MATEVDELFGGVGDAEPRRARVYGVLLLGMVVSLAGLTCSVLPGALIVGWGLNNAEIEAQRIQSGFYPVSATPAIRRMRVAAYISLLGVLALFFAQAMMLYIGVYDIWWNVLIDQFLMLIP